MYIHYFVIIWSWAGAFIWTNLNSLHLRMLCVKFGWNCPSGSREEDFFLFFQCISAIWLLSPLGKGRGPSFEQTWVPFTQTCFVLSLVKISPVVLVKKMKMRKVYRQTDRQTDGRTTDNRRSEKLTWAFSSGELKKFLNLPSWFYSRYPPQSFRCKLPRYLIKRAFQVLFLTLSVIIYLVRIPTLWTMKTIRNNSR